MASRLEHWQLSMPCQNNQYHYRTLLPKLALVDLQDRPVKLITEKGNKAVFTQVFLDFDELEAVKANPIAPGPDALDRALNQVRAQLDQSPIDPEWRTPTDDRGLFPDSISGDRLRELAKRVSADLPVSEVIPALDFRDIAINSGGLWICSSS